MAMTISENPDRYFYEDIVKSFRQYRGIVVRFNRNRDTLREYINRQSGLHRTNHVSQVQTVSVRTTSLVANVAIKR